MEEHKGYEVIRFIEHGNLTRVTMDYVAGKLLYQWIREEKVISKQQLYKGLQKLVEQLDLFYRCKKNQCYRFISPESIVIAENEEVYLLDLEAESNTFVMRDMQKQNMRNCFIKKGLNIQGDMRLETDLYSLGKTIQYVLSRVQIEEKLTRKEKLQLSNIIQKCLGNQSKRIYENLNQIKKDIPICKKRSQRQIKRKWSIYILLCVVIVIGVWSLHSYIYQKTVPDKEQEIENEEQSTTQVKREQVEEETSRDSIKEEPMYIQGRMDELKTNLDVLQKYLQQNNKEDNQKLINEGSTIEKELVRYLAAAYDREEEYEEAITYYQRLMEIETSQEQLKMIVLRKITLEFQLGKEENAKATCEMGLSICPEFAQTDEFEKIQQENGLKVEGDKVWLEKE